MDTFRPAPSRFTFYDSPVECILVKLPQFSFTNRHRVFRRAGIGSGHRGEVVEAVGGHAQVAEGMGDVEGEGDLLCAIEHDLDPVLTSTGGAGTTSGHERCRDLLTQLDIGEVQIVRDRDDAGRHGAKITAAFWDSLSVPNKIIELPAEVGDGGDLRDYFTLLSGEKLKHRTRS